MECLPVGRQPLRERHLRIRMARPLARVLDVRGDKTLNSIRRPQTTTFGIHELGVRAQESPAGLLENFERSFPIGNSQVSCDHPCSHESYDKRSDNVYKEYVRTTIKNTLET